MSITKVFGKKATGAAWVILACGAAVCATSAVQADEAPPHKVVQFNDLNLNNREGAAVLYRRIKGAASEVCGKQDRFHLAQSRDIKICISDAVSRAVAEVNSPVLTSLYQSKTGKSDLQTATLAQTR